MSSSESPLQKYQRLLNFLHADVNDLPTDVEPVNVDRDAILAATRLRAGRLRFLRARSEMEAARSKFAHPSLSELVVRKARAILDQIVKSDAASRETFSLAFRSGRSLPDSEVLSILSEFQALGHDLDAIADRLED